MESTFDFILIRNTFVTNFFIKNVSARLIYLISQLLAHSLSFKARVIHQIISNKVKEARWEINLRQESFNTRAIKYFGL